MKTKTKRAFALLMLALIAPAAAQAAITCSKPTELTATEITANSVKLSWTENGEATAWEIQYSTDADNIDEGTTILVTENPYTLTGLTAQTTYYARVRAVCGEGDYSNWNPTATFTTAEPVKYKITIERTPNDYDFPFIFPSLTPSAEGNYYAPGTQVRVDIPDPNRMGTLASPGAYFAFLFVDGVKVDVIEEDHLLVGKRKYYTFTMPEADVIIVVKYTMRDMYHITKSCDPADGGTISGPSWSRSGRIVTLTATPNEGYAFKGWYNGTALVSPDTPYTFTPTGDVTLTAVFAKLYPLWIGDTQVDEANKDDIPGITGENAKASFDPATNTLIFENVTGVTGSTMGALITAEGINLTVEGSAVLEDKNIDMGIQVAPGSLTLDGDFTISAGSYGIYVQKDVTMVKGSLFAKGKAVCGIYSARGTLKVNGGTLETMGSMCALGTAPDFSGYTDEYEVLVNENYNAEGASQWSGDDVYDPLGGFSSSYKYVKIIPIITPTLVLLDDDSEADSKNQELIQANLGEQVGKVNVMLEGRTIYRDGRWNSICLPFNLEDGDDSDGKNCTGTLFEGAIIKRLDSSSYTPETKTLTLNFEDSESIWTGGPYLVRWDSSENLENLVNPVFKNVEIIDGEPLPDTSDCIDFLGTFSPVTLAAQDRTVLYLGGDSKLYYPSVDVPVNAFRGYFQLKDGLKAGDLPANGAKNIVLNFGNGETTSITSVDSGELTTDSYYSIDGRRLQGEPAKKGIYIKNGKKVIK